MLLDDSSQCIIKKISKDDFLKMKSELCVLSDECENPREYFQLTSNKYGINCLIEQTDLGLTDIPNAIISPNLFMIATSFKLFVFDPKTQKIENSIGLDTCCVKLLVTEEKVFVICELGVIEYLPTYNEFSSGYAFTDIVTRVDIEGNKVMILLDDGTTVKIENGMILF